MDGRTTSHIYIVKIVVAISILIISNTSCSRKEWTDEQRKEFDKNCSQTDTFANVIFDFRGFDNNEFDSVLVKEYNDTILVDEFKIFVRQAQSQYDIEQKNRSFLIARTMHTKHTYHFIVPGQEPFVLANMKMVMWAQYTESSEGWGCEMGNYTIDGVRFEYNANPMFIKRDSIQIIK